MVVFRIREIRKSGGRFKILKPHHLTLAMSHDDNLEKVVAAMHPAGPPKRDTKEYTMKDFQAVLDSTPLFMSQTPEDSEDNEVLQALQSLMFEGEGDGELSIHQILSQLIWSVDIAMNFKNHGNELYVQKTYKEAVTAYTQGLEAGPKDEILKVSLLNNRAACNLAMKNYREVLKDTGVIIILSIQKGKSPPVKAMFRAGQALVALSRWKEALDVVKRGMEMVEEKEQGVWKGLEKDIEKGVKRDGERSERVRRERLKKVALKRAIQVRRTYKHRA
jgi:tetratricopeptide (TPR) repeat protein